MPDFNLDAALTPAPETLSSLKVVAEYMVVDIGIENGQYFQGVGRGQFDDVFVGVGDTPSEALDEALNQAAYEWNVDSVESPYTPAHDREFCVHERLHREWVDDLDPDVLEGLEGDERQDRIDELWQEAIDDGYGQDIGYFVGLRLRERREGDA